MRFHVWMFLNDEDGKPVPGADISVYLAGTDIPATIFTGEFTSDTISVAPQVKTNTMGYFEFWIGDSTESAGYDSNQKFKLRFERLGILDGFIDYVDVFPGYIEVDEYSTDTLRNKTISNRLAFLWEQHRNDDSHLVHGIEEVDENDDDDQKNKLVSNKIINDLTTRYNFDFSKYDWSNGKGPFGLERVDVDSLDKTFNKLVNNYYAYYWQRHIEKKLGDGVSPDELDVHGLQIVDPQKTDDTFNKLVSNGFMRNIYLLLNESLRVKELEIHADEWLYHRGYNLYRLRVYHNLDTVQPIVACYDNNKLIYPTEIVIVNNKSFDIYMPINIDLKINVSGQGERLKV